MKKSIGATLTENVVGGFGGFAGMFDVSFLKSFDRPLLATSTDGVGTKVAIAQAIDKHDTIGQDLVGMVVDDIVVVGAKSMFMTDYIATGKVVQQELQISFQVLPRLVKKLVFHLSVVKQLNTQDYLSQMNMMLQVQQLELLNTANYLVPTKFRLAMLY
jgi:hypothetical protein